MIFVNNKELKNLTMWSEPVKYIYFHNKTDVPVSISSWVDGSNTMHSFVAPPQKNILIHSSVGEWHLDAMFQSDEDSAIWKEKGLEKYLLVGKFRSQPCASGNYSWMKYDKFECVYSELEDSKNAVKGQITFTIN